MERIILREITNVRRFGIPDRRWERASASDHFIAYKIYGTTVHESDGRTLSFEKDWVMLANSADAYRVTQHDPQADGLRGGCIAIHFTTEIPMNMHLSICDCRSNAQIKWLFFRILDDWNLFSAQPTAGCFYALTARFYAILSLVMPLMMNEMIPESENRARQIADYMERNFANSALAIADIASVMNIGQRRINEVFKAAYQKTPQQYLTMLRMRSAVQLLHDKQLTVSDVATLVGYTDPTYFIRVFHREMGCSPNEYRKSRAKEL